MTTATDVVENALNLQNQINTVSSKVLHSVFTGKPGAVDMLIQTTEGPDWKVTVKATRVRKTTTPTVTTTTKRAKKTRRTKKS